MKQLLACIVFLAASAWSFFGLQWTSLQFEKGYLNIDTTRTCNVDPSYINCSLDDGLVYYSTLDTNYVVVSKPRIAKILIVGWIPHDSITTSFTFPHSETDVLRYEFMKWQEWGILKMSRDSAQKMIDRIVLDSSYITGCRMPHKTVCDEDPSLCRCSPAGGGGANEVSQEDANRLPQKKVLLSAESENPGTTSLPHKSSKEIQGVGYVPPGTGYKAFDMNGIYLYRGAWNGSFTVHGNPVIFKFDNGRIAVFR